VSPARSTSKPTRPARKPKADVYTVLLIVALISILISITFLYFEMDLYNFEIKGAPRARLDRPAATDQIGTLASGVGVLGPAGGGVPVHGRSPTAAWS
jgi:hypothetical protein